MTLTTTSIAHMIDISAVRADSSDRKIAEVIACAQNWKCYLVTVLPSQTRRAKMLLGECGVKLGGNVGFPSGGQTLSIKVQETLELVSLGVDEIDMVMDVAAHLSGRYEDIYQEITAVVETSQGRPVKVILECHYLDEAQIRIGCDIAIRAGAAFVKTGTGWAPTGATLENVTLIKRHVSDAIQIKASGGVHGIETLLEMHRRGATRFGISAAHVGSMLAARENHIPLP